MTPKMCLKWAIDAVHISYFVRCIRAVHWSFATKRSTSRHSLYLSELILCSRARCYQHLLPRLEPRQIAFRLADHRTPTGWVSGGGRERCTMFNVRGNRAGLVSRCSGGWGQNQRIGCVEDTKDSAQLTIGVGNSIKKIKSLFQENILVTSTFFLV